MKETMKNFIFILCMSFVFISVFHLFQAPPSHGASRDGVELQDSVFQGGHRLVLNGTGTRKATIFSVRVYVMGLYLEKKSNAPEAIIGSRGSKRIVMKFVRNVGASKLKKGWDEGFGKNYPDFISIKEKIEEFKSVMSDVKKGQGLVLDFIENRVDVFHDKEKTASIQGNEFQQALLSVWLGPKPPNAELKRGILGE